ncbi:MAG: hypothetical protein JNL01_04175 [Bdellovibrionales bacterium]|nr:hypothetical protein [Bdellovibrionales bacterium]
MKTNLKQKLKSKAPTLAWLWFSCGATASVTALSLSSASLPQSGRVTDDTAIYQNLSEIRAKRDHKPNFDSDINSLAAMESSHRESQSRLKSDLEKSRKRSEMKRARAERRSKKSSKRVAGRKDRVRTSQARPLHSLDGEKMARVMSPLKRIEETKYVPTRGAR